MVDWNTNISMITTNVNELNAPNQRTRFSDCIKKQDWIICYLQETHTKYKGEDRLKVNWIEKNVPFKH